MNSLKSLYYQISSLQSLSPSPKVNKLFSKLVLLSLQDQKITLSSNHLHNLQKICGQAEYELEKYWAKRIINNQKAFNEFPYIDNYQKLTKMEWHSLLGCSMHTKHNVLFVGGGPLPLTAIVLAQRYDLSVTVIEKEQEAVDLSRNLIQKLALKHKVTIIHQDALRFRCYSDFNVIFVAALAGVDSSIKKEILDHIKTCSKKGTHLIARSSWGSRGLLYRPLDTKLFCEFNTLVEVRPHNDIVNSIVIFEV